MFPFIIEIVGHEFICTYHCIRKLGNVTLVELTEKCDSSCLLYLKFTADWSSYIHSEIKLHI